MEKHIHESQHEQTHVALNSSDIEINWSWSPEKINPNSPIEVRLQLLENKKPAILDITHEKPVHLLVIHKNLTYFAHLHPMEELGTYKAVATLPEFGHYKLFADFSIHQQPKLETTWLYAEGPWTPYEPVQLNTDTGKRVEDGVVVDLQLHGDLQKPKEPIHMKFSFSEQETGEPVALRAYLGESGHVVIVNEHLDEYLHVHPAATFTEGSHEADFHTSFPQVGYYKIWAQFRVKDRIQTHSYTVFVGPIS